MRPEFPEGVRELIVEVGEKLKKGTALGPSLDNDENAALLVIGLLQDKWMNTNPQKTIEVWDWAMKQHFKLLLIDWRRLGFFRDHELCEPKGQSEKIS